MSEIDRMGKVFVNPLAFFEVDEPWASIEKRPPTAEDILRYLCAPNVSSNVESIVERYQHVSVEGDNRLFVVPSHEQILQKLTWPLRYAKGAYALGDSLGTIALCGTVAEMLSILTFEMADTFMTKSGQTEPMSPDYQSCCSGMNSRSWGKNAVSMYCSRWGLLTKRL